jgi:hypothetical protein
MCLNPYRLMSLPLLQVVERHMVWQAAVAAATNSALNSLPAFGGRRPDEAWLAQQLT